MTDTTHTPGPGSATKSDVFLALRAILARHAGQLVVVSDDDTNYTLNTRYIMPNKKPMFFGAVNVAKNYVSYHLMPVYVNPRLLESVSEPLRKRMQGKSCFNFTSLDPALLEELAALTESGYRDYVESGYIGRPDD